MPFICKCQKIKSTTRHLNLSYISILTNLLRTQYICTYICTYILFLSLLKQNEICLSCSKKPLNLLVYWFVVKKNVPNVAKSLVTPSGEVWNHSSH